MLVSCELCSFGLYCDDGLASSIADKLVERDGRPMLGLDGHWINRAEVHFALAREVLVELGHVSAPDKEQPPSRRITALGVELDLDAARMWLGRGKAERYAVRAEVAASRQVVEHAEYMGLLGRLTFAATIYPLGRPQLQACWRIARATFRLQGDQVLVTERARRALQWWARELRREDHEGVPLASRAWVPPPGEPGSTAVYADASGEEGFAAWLVHGDVVFMVASEWSEWARSTLDISDKELLASTAGLVCLAPLADAQYVREFTDNTVALAAMRASGARSLAAQRLVGERVAWMHEHGVLSSASRITSGNNEWADIGSRPRTRGGWREVCEQAHAVGMRFVRAPLPREWTEDGLLARLVKDA